MIIRNSTKYEHSYVHVMNLVKTSLLAQKIEKSDNNPFFQRMLKVLTAKLLYATYKKKKKKITKKTLNLDSSLSLQEKKRKIR